MPTYPARSVRIFTQTLCSVVTRVVITTHSLAAPVTRIVRSDSQIQPPHTPHVLLTYVVTASGPVWNQRVDLVEV